MKRFAAHLIYCNPQQIIPAGVIEVDEKGVVKAIFSLNDIPQESHSTIFYNGILIPDLINKEQLVSYNSKDIIKLLDKLYASKMIGFKVGEKAQIYLLENLDLVGMKFLSETTHKFLEAF